MILAAFVLTASLSINDMATWQKQSALDPSRTNGEVLADGAEAGALTVICARPIGEYGKLLMEAAVMTYDKDVVHAYTLGIIGASHAIPQLALNAQCGAAVARNILQ